MCGRHCVYWNLKHFEWSNKGCFLNPYKSSEYETTCDCYHLTNFGIIMDFTGNADPFNSFLDYFSIITMIISIGCIILAELVLHHQR